MKKFGLRVLCGFFFITISSAMENNQLTIVDDTNTKNLAVGRETYFKKIKSDTKLRDKKSDQAIDQLLCGCLQFVDDHINPTISDPEKVKAVLIAKIH